MCVLLDLFFLITLITQVTMFYTQSCRHFIYICPVNKWPPRASAKPQVTYGFLVPIFQERETYQMFAYCRQPLNMCRSDHHLYMTLIIVYGVLKLVILHTEKLICINLTCKKVSFYMSVFCLDSFSQENFWIASLCNVSTNRK